MINPTGKKLEKLIFGIFDDASQGVDIYNHNGSLWLIITNEMRWIVEYTKDQTLWYNYNFFKGEMDLIGLNCVEDKVLIKKWFESRFLGIPKVEDLCEPFFDQDQYVQDTIQNGVKDTMKWLNLNITKIKDTIENGVRHTAPDASTIVYAVEDAIQNGVKDTLTPILFEVAKVEDAIENGVKHTIHGMLYRNFRVEDTIQKGVKDTKLGAPDNRDYFIEDTIQNGVRMAKSAIISQDSYVEDVIQNAVKETYDDCSNNIARVEGIIRIGEKIS